MPLADFRPNYLTLNKQDDVVVAAITMSRLTDEENTEQLGHELFALVEQYDCRKVVIDMAAVEYTTSSVLGKLISMHRKLHRHDGTLVICHVRDGVVGTLKTSRLLDYFNVADDLDAAFAMLK